MKKTVGQTGEVIAADYIQRHGLKLLHRNLYLSGVEADIVAMDGRTLVVIEVKTKRGLSFGLPQEMVTKRKQDQLRRFVRGWWAKNGECPIRIDVAAVYLGDAEPRIEYLENAVGGC